MRSYYAYAMNRPGKNSSFIEQNDLIQQSLLSFMHQRKLAEVALWSRCSRRDSYLMCFKWKYIHSIQS